MDYSWLIKFVFVALAIAAAATMNFIFKAKEDNPVEEIAEEVIKNETGLEIDLTPTSSEKK